jgi:hypothetical protein
LNKAEAFSCVEPFYGAISHPSSPNTYHPHNAVASVSCDLKLEIDDLHREPEISVKEYFTRPT